MNIIDRPSVTKAAILVQQNKPLIVDTIELPTTLKVGQVLVNIHVSGICGSQLGEIDGVKGHDPYLPHLMGHEGFGVVLDTGPGVKTVKKGDHVVLHWRQGAGIQSDPPTYTWRGENLNAGWVTTFNHHAVISENRCTSIPKDISKDDAALFGCAVTTGFGVIENNAKVKIGESVVVLGAGGIGLNIIQAANLVSAWPIIAVDLFDSRLELAKKLGATHIINSSCQNTRLMIKEILGEKNLDVFIDNTGLPPIIEMGYELVSTQGRVVLVGVPSKGSNINIYSLPLHFGKTISGSFGGECKPEIDIPRYMQLLKQGKWSLKNIVSTRYNLDQINDAILSMREGRTAGRVMIDM